MPRGLVIMLGAAAAVITVAGIQASAWLITPMLLALIIVIVVSPAHRWLRRRGFPAWAATAGLVLLVYAILIGFVLVMIVSVARLVDLLPEYTEQARVLAAQAVDVAGRVGIRSGQLR